MYILVGTGILVAAQTWLRVETRNDIPAKTLTSSTEESLSGTEVMRKEGYPINWFEQLPRSSVVTETPALVKRFKDLREDTTPFRETGR